AAHNTETLGKRAVDDVDAVHDPVTLGNATTARTIKADGVHFIEIGERVVLLGEVTNGADRRDVPVHRVDALEGDDLRRLAGNLLQPRFKIGKVVVLKNLLRTAAIADAGDH